MDKSRKIFKKTGKYLREISVVVIGVAITLSVSQWINNKNNKKDIEIYLNAIKIDLENIISSIEIVKGFYIIPDIQYTNYLVTHREKSLHKDSLESYYLTYTRIASLQYNSNALELFKNSNVMHLIDSIELLLLLWDIDSGLNLINRVIESHHREKMDEFNKAKNENTLLIERLDLSDIKNAPLYNYYVHAPEYDRGNPHFLMGSVDEFLNIAKEAVVKLENMKL
jgi:hypothetical protein